MMHIHVVNPLHADCFAGDDGNLATSQGQSSSCNSTCAMAPSEMCGGYYIMLGSVFWGSIGYRMEAHFWKAGC